MAELSLYDLNNKIEAYKYTHPATHPATIITEDSTHRFVSDIEKDTWNKKATTAVATGTSDGLMSAADKSKLNGIQAGAEINQFAFGNIKVGTVGIAANAKVTTIELIQGSNIVLTPDATGKTVTITNTYSYTHPTTHPATMITEDSTHRFVTDADKSNWNSKAETDVVTTTTNGLMIAADKVKLNGIAAGAQVNPTNAVILSSAKSADGASNGWARVNPATPREGDISTNANGYVWVFAGGAWQQVFPPYYHA